jgi:hypothetical protein
MWREYRITHSIVTFIEHLQMIATAFGHYLKRKELFKRGVQVEKERKKIVTSKLQTEGV